MTDSGKWWDNPWNPVCGCKPASEGCANCYARRLHDQRHAAWAVGRWPGAPACYQRPFPEVQLFYGGMDKPMHWRKPREIFCCNMGDLLHEEVPDGFLDCVFGIMNLCQQHRFYVCTKRAERLPKYFDTDNREHAIAHAGMVQSGGNWKLCDLPLRNVMLMVTAENQARANERIPLLLRTPAAMRGVSVEPMLGPVDLASAAGVTWWDDPSAGLKWVVCGGESGQGARPMNPDWARALRDQCREAGIPFWFKQMSGRAEIPADLRVREKA